MDARRAKLEAMIIIAAESLGVSPGTSVSIVPMLMFDVYNNTAPHNISHLFIPTQQIHSYSTRSSSSGNYYISHSRLNQKNDSFSIMGAKIWNSIPENLRNSSKSLFKEKVHTILLKIFEVQDRYADLNTIISDFKKILVPLI